MTVQQFPRSSRQDGSGTASDDDGFRDIDAKDATGRTALHHAAGLGDIDRVRALLAAGADPHVLDSRVGASPLHHAAQAGVVDVARLLLDAGAFLNLQAPSHGVTPLMAAVWFRKPDMVAFLLDQPGINVELVSAMGATARGFIDFGAREGDPHAQRQRDRMRELFDAYEAHRAELLRSQPLFSVLVDPELDAEAKTTRVSRLLAGGARVDTTAPVYSSGSDGHTPLLVAARDGLTDVVALLLDAGADQTATDTYMRAVPAHKACFMGHAEVLRLLVAAPRFREIAEAQGPYNGYTPLHDATWHGHTDAVRVLLDAGVRTDPVAWDGKTALDLAREYDYGDVVRLLRAAADRPAPG